MKEQKILWRNGQSHYHKIIFSVSPMMIKGIVMGLVLLLFSHSAWAADPYSIDPSVMLENILNYLTGTIGKTIAAIAFAVTGIGSMVMGKFSRGWFYGVCIGIVIIFGANFILDQIMGS
ncbi:MAG: TrbC/VirB2 family protein [Pseudomonadota bacterium]